MKDEENQQQTNDLLKDIRLAMTSEADNSVQIDLAQDSAE